MNATAILQQEREISDRLARAWPVFFARFGRLTPVQRVAVPRILAGDDVLLCSSTASGKTEAACAPLVERFIDRVRPWTVLYISPTRALVNDLYERLSTPLDRLGLRVVRRTGDHKDSIDAVPHVLLTTPESFDSLLCRGRRKDDLGHTVAHVTAVVLDEIHLLHGTARGEQVRWLLSRLRRLRSQAEKEGWTRGSGVQTVALSATVSAPEAVAAAYLRSGVVLHVPGGREIETVQPPCERPNLEVALQAYLAHASEPEKVLVFCNGRRRVDDLTTEMRPPLAELGYEVAAHHGSLSQREREASEQAVKTRDRIVVFATSTLEIGIDIGDVDLVVLDGPAPDIPALLQRIGRGNRRTLKTRVMACSGSLDETLVHSAMIDAAREGWLGPVENGPQHAVARQQIASYIFQSPRRERRRASLQGLLDECAAPVVSRTLLNHLLREELVEDASGIRLGQDWLDQTTRGEIHSNIEGNPGVSVVDEHTGQQIATGVKFAGGRGLNAGGHLLEVKKWGDRKLEVRKLRQGATPQGQWGYHSKAWMRGAGQPQAVRRYLGIGDNAWPVLHDAGLTYVFHFGGGRRKAVLKLIVDAAAGASGVRTSEWFITLPGQFQSPPVWLAQVTPALLSFAIARNLDSLEYTLGRPGANRRLPVEARQEEVGAWLKLPEEVAAIHAAKWYTPAEPDLVAALQCFL
jgi:ATP-dependent Lhr-like helicase